MAFHKCIAYKMAAVTQVRPIHTACPYCCNCPVGPDCSKGGKVRAKKALGKTQTFPLEPFGPIAPLVWTARSGRLEHFSEMQQSAIRMAASSPNLCGEWSIWALPLTPCLATSVPFSTGAVLDSYNALC